MRVRRCDTIEVLRRGQMAMQELVKRAVRGVHQLACRLAEVDDVLQSVREEDTRNALLRLMQHVAEDGLPIPEVGRLPKALDAPRRRCVEVVAQCASRAVEAPQIVLTGLTRRDRR